MYTELKKWYTQKWCIQTENDACIQLDKRCIHTVTEIMYKDREMNIYKQSNYVYRQLDKFCIQTVDIPTCCCYPFQHPSSTVLQHPSNLRHKIYNVTTPVVTNSRLRSVWLFFLWLHHSIMLQCVQEVWSMCNMCTKLCNVYRLCTEL